MITIGPKGVPEATVVIKVIATGLLVAVIGLVLINQYIPAIGVMLIMLAMSVNLHLRRLRYFKTRR